MSYFEKIIPAFIRGDEKIPVDSAKNDRLPVALSPDMRDVLKEIRDLLTIQNIYLAEIVGEEFNLK